MVKMVMTVQIRLVQGGEKVKDQNVDEAHGKNRRVYSKGGVLHAQKKVIIRSLIKLINPVLQNSNQFNICQSTQQ